MAKKAEKIFDTAFSSYRVVEIIGEGGSGRVYKVEDENSEVFALKILNPHSLSRQKIKRFKNELLFCTNNEHPNVLKVIDWGYHQIEGKKCPFYIMPYYQGTLRKLIKKEIPNNKILPYFSQMLDGIESAHLQGIFHRDLKPENILYFSKEDKLILADFGIAHYTQEHLYTAVETHNNERLANFQYSAPEQRTRDKPVTHLADIYSIGLVLNEMFTGAIPQGTGYITIGTVAKEFSYLDDLVELMIRQNPEERPNSIDEIKRELIGRKNDFVQQQKLNELKKRVVPSTEVSDPLIDEPVRLIDIDYENENLIFELNHEVTPDWISTFHSIGNWSALMGREPSKYQFYGNKAYISSSASQDQQIVDNFKQHLETANRDYKNKLIDEQRKREYEQRMQLKKQIEEEEKRKKIRENLRI